MNQLKLDLLQNCFSFVKESLKKAIIAEHKPDEWKYSILFLVQAIELALKEKLRREHPILIYKNIDKANETVSLDYAIKRIQNIANIQFTTDDISAIEKAKEIRNEIVHYEIDRDVISIKVIFSTLLGFLDNFISIHLKDNLKNKFNEGLWKEVITTDEYLKEIRERALLRIEQEKINKNKIIECYDCGFETFVVGKSEGICYVCNFKNIIVKCYECEGDFLEYMTTSFADKYLCFNCHPFNDLFDNDEEDSVPAY